MDTRPLVATALVIVTIAVAGCTSPQAPQAAAREASSSNPASADVAMMNTQFSPASLTVKAGATVTWTNHDPAGHTVTPTDKALWGTDGSGDDAAQWINNGQTWSHTFAQPGTYKYYCAPHSGKGANGEYTGMTGTIIVQA
jgi:plastocyanin